METLWSVENNRMNKVSHSKPCSDNDIFESLAQKSIKKFDREDTPTEGIANEKVRTCRQEHLLPKNQPPSAYFSNLLSSIS